MSLHSCASLLGKVLQAVQEPLDTLVLFLDWSE